MRTLGENSLDEIMPLFCLQKIGDLRWGTEQRKATTGNVDLSQIIQLVHDLRNLLARDLGVYERLCAKVVAHGGKIFISLSIGSLTLEIKKHNQQFTDTLNTGPTLTLTGYLDKIVSLHVSADVLIRYACSPRLRTHFTNKKFDLATMPNTPYTRTLSTTREQWVECLQKAFCVGITRSPSNRGYDSSKSICRTKGTLTFMHNETIHHLEECLYDPTYSNLFSGQRINRQYSPLNMEIDGYKGSISSKGTIY